MDHHHSMSRYGDQLYSVLELCLEDILACIKPSEHDRLRRLYAMNELTTIVCSVESLKGVIIRPFGSFTSNLYSKWGDLDISVELCHRSPSSTIRRHKQNVLRNIMRLLRMNGVARNVTFVPYARVPLLIFESNLHNVSCDVSVDNHMGCMKSKILLWISEIDERLRDMVLLTKEWAKAHQINDPKTGTLNSYSLCLLVIFLFQTCKPAILPPLKDIYDGNLCHVTGSWSILERQIEATCAANISRFKSLQQRNQSTVCDLFIYFFDKLSEIEGLASNYVICTYTGQWERKINNPRWMEKPYSLFIEDPFERPDNAARAVGLRELNSISEAFKRTSRVFSSNTELLTRDSLLATLVRPGISYQLMVGTQNPYTSQVNQLKHQAAVSGYAISCYADSVPLQKMPNRSSEVRVGTSTHVPARSNGTLQHKAGQSHYAAVQGNQPQPQVAYSGCASRVDNQHYHQSPAANNNRHWQGYSNAPVQQVWMPRNPNR